MRFDILFCAASLLAGAHANIISAETEQFIAQLFKEWGVTGASIAIVQGDPHPAAAPTNGTGDAQTPPKPSMRPPSTGSYFGAPVGTDVQASPPMPSAANATSDEDECDDSDSNTDPDKPAPPTAASQIITLGSADANGTPVNEESLFAIASNTKHFAALAAKILIDNNTTLPNGKNFTLFTKVKDVLPDFQMQDNYTTYHADIEDVMAMRLGLLSEEYSYGPNTTASEAVANLVHFRPRWELRRTYKYTNQNYMLLAEIVRAVSGEPFEQFVTSNILVPLGLNATTFDWPAARQSGKQAMPFTAVPAPANAKKCQSTPPMQQLNEPSCHDTMVTFDPVYGPAFAGPGGLLTNARDMVTWMQAHISSSEGPRGLFKSAQTATPFMVAGGAATEGRSALVYSYGIESASHSGINMLTHTGSLPGYLSMLMIAPGAKFGVMIMTNDQALGDKFMMVAATRIIEDIGKAPTFTTDNVAAAFSIAKAPPPGEDAPPGQATAEQLKSVTAALPAIDLAAVPGRYSHPAYGVLEFSVLDPNTTDDALKVLLEALRSEGTPTTRLFVARMNALFATHAVLQHQFGNVFSWLKFPVVPVRGVLPKTPRCDGDATGRCNGTVPQTTTEPAPSAVYVVPNADTMIMTPTGFAAWESLNAFDFTALSPATPTADELKEQADWWFQRE